MKKRKNKRSAKIGAPPGTLLPSVEGGDFHAEISVIQYDGENISEKKITDPDTIKECLKDGHVTWVNVSSVSDVESVSKIGKTLNIHSLVTEDIVSTHQRPKTEVYDEYVYEVFKMITYDPDLRELDVEQVSLIFGRNYVVTFQERPGDVFDPIRERIRGAKGRIRKAGADYLAYALVDVVVDNYFLALEHLGEDIDEFEAKLVDSPEPQMVRKIHDLKRVMINLRKAVWPLRESILVLERAESDLVAASTRPYLRDVYDHCVQVIDTVESMRDVLSGYLDIYLSLVSNRMNEVMKVLTIIATLFIPLTFIAGIYGMNFEYMPELKWEWSYPILWGVMLVVLASMIMYFKRRRWL